MMLKNKGVIPLPTYLGRHTVKIKIEEIAAGIDVIWIVTVITCDLEEKKCQYYRCRKNPRTGKDSSSRW